MAEIIEQDIIDSTIEVGSGCKWIGSGTEPQWENPKSMKAYDHIENYHGPKRKANRFIGRAASTNDDRGQWLNPEDWIIAEQLVPKYWGSYIIDFQRPIGRVYHPDGTITKNVTRAFIQRHFNGTLNSGYPVVNSRTLSRLKEMSNSEE